MLAVQLTLDPDSQPQRDSRLDRRRFLRDVGSRADTRHSQNFPEKPHLRERPQEVLVAFLNPACVGIPAWARPWGSWYHDQQKGRDKKGGTI